MRKYLIASVVCLLACGGDDDDGSSVDPPTEQELCSLSVGVSSRADVIGALGPATASTNGADLSLLHYDYSGAQVATSVGDVVSLMIILDENGVFDDANTINIPFPECWSAEIEARDRARELGFAGD